MNMSDWIKIDRTAIRDKLEAYVTLVNDNIKNHFQLNEAFVI